MHGTGKMTYKNGDIYEGDWADGYMHGTGTMIYDNGDKYDGGWVKNKKHGMGTFTYNNRRQVRGKWVNDVYQQPIGVLHKIAHANGTIVASPHYGS